MNLESNENEIESKENEPIRNNRKEITGSQEENLDNLAAITPKPTIISGESEGEEISGVENRG